MAPPLRSARDREALREGLADGTIDCLATDHAPHALYEKDVEFTAAPFGVVGFETALPVALELVREERITPLELADRLSTRPARVLGISGGTLEPGGPADLVLIDPERVWKVDGGRLCSRSKNSPFLGRELRGRALRTWVGGRLSFALGEEAGA
jgi:dihydroorotase